MRRAAFTDGRSCGELGDAKVRGACSETRLVALVNATSSRLSIVPFANGPKTSMRHVLGRKKINFFTRCADDATTNLSIRGPEVSRWSLEVATGRVQAPTPHARALPSVYTYQYRSSARHRAGAQVPKVLDPELSGELQEPARAV